MRAGHQGGCPNLPATRPKANLHLLHVGEASPPAKRIDYDGLNFHRIVRPGPVVGTILEVAEEVSADLIVMATAGHKSVLDALRGSTTEAVLRKSHRPLLAVPTRSAYAMASRSGMVAGPSAARLPPA